MERMRTAVRAFGYPRFTIVWSGETLSMLGDFSYEVVFVWLVLHVTGSVGTLTAVLVVQAVPFGVLLLLGAGLRVAFSANARRLSTDAPAESAALR